MKYRTNAVWSMSPRRTTCGTCSIGFVCVCDFDYIIILDQRRGWSLRNENNNEKGWSTHVNPLWITIVYGIVEKHKTRVFYFQLAMN
mmetsp:Transcript_17051/g.17103  ORF Transcript_17051/g.17103 Transcript_17051/m.17103 type:complete len:87 (+) Transcript_17051:507-767(+)